MCGRVGTLAVAFPASVSSLLATIYKLGPNNVWACAADNLQHDPSLPL